MPHVGTADIPDLSEVVNILTVAAANTVDTQAVIDIHDVLAALDTSDISANVN